MRCILSILLLVLLTRLDAAVAVVHDGLPIQLMSKDRVRDLLLGRISTWETGVPVVIVLCTDPNERAVEELSGRNVALLQRGWKRLVFSGTGAMPLVATTRQSALDLVAKHPGAIAVLEASDQTPGCKVITIGQPVPSH